MCWADTACHQRAAALQLRRRIQPAVSSRMCEEVVGFSLDLLVSPTQQLARLLPALQQALA